jgi:hypothetical protein
MGSSLAGVVSNTIEVLCRCDVMCLLGVVSEQQKGVGGLSRGYACACMQLAA